jgi:two-component system chemotaxis response regulator CheB
MNKVRVLVVDDSALMRQMLSEILGADPSIEVVGTASDPYAARTRIKAVNPDVLTLDVEMPKMDGVTFLGNLMRLHPLPVVMVSSLTKKGAETTLQALELGAVDFIAKPKMDVVREIQGYADELREKVKTAARVRVKARDAGSVKFIEGSPAHSADGVSARRYPRALPFRTTEQIVAVGASTGGTEAIKEILMAMPPDAPGMVITQHIPSAFSAPFAERMNRMSSMAVCEAQDGQQISPGHVYIAPGDMHLLVERSGARYICRLNAGPPVNRHRPSVDVMFRSVVQSAGANAVGVLLTGMGADGADGLVELCEARAHTIVQDEASSVVWGMPGAAVARGGAEQILPLTRIPDAILAAVSEQEAQCAAHVNG